MLANFINLEWARIINLTKINRLVPLTGKRFFYEFSFGGNTPKHPCATYRVEYEPSQGWKRIRHDCAFDILLVIPQPDGSLWAMKILMISILAALSVNANEVV